MSRLSRSAKLLQNAEAALISAIEIYNKPNFAYREETFAILALNAWELLVKAKLLHEHRNDPRCLYVYYAPKTKNDRTSKKLRVKRNRTGNIMTVSFDNCLAALEKKGIVVPGPVKKNIEALTEIRDNAVHYMNASPQLAKQVLEIGTASLGNFIELGKLWLDLDLSSYSLYLMPIGFLPSLSTATAITISNGEKNVVNYLASLMRQGNDEAVPDYHVSLDVNISFKRKPATAANAVMVTTDPTALKVTMSEEDIRNQYPWDYNELIKHLRKRYINFKVNNEFHRLRKNFVVDPQYMKSRYLDPRNLKGSRKDFFNPNIVSQFDKYYTLKK